MRSTFVSLKLVDFCALAFLVAGSACDVPSPPSPSPSPPLPPSPPPLPPPPPDLKIALENKEAVVAPGETVRLSATASGSLSTKAQFQWERIDGPPLESIPSSEQAVSTIDFTAPEPSPCLKNERIRIRVTATAEMLSVSDDAEITVFNPICLVTQTANGLRSNDTKKIVVSQSDQRVWIATPSGLNSFDGQAWDFFNRVNAPKLPADDIAVLGAAPNGDIWIAARGQKNVQKVIEGKMTDSTEWIDVKLDNSEVFAMDFGPFIGNYYDTYVGTERGVRVVSSDDNQQRAVFLADQRVFSAFVKNSTEIFGVDATGKSSPADTIYVFDRDTQKSTVAALSWNGVFSFPAFYNNAWARAVLRQNNGKLWIGLAHFTLSVDSGGIVSCDVGICTKPMGARYDIRAIAEDSKGDVWFATDGGLLRYNPAALDVNFSFDVFDQNSSEKIVACADIRDVFFDPIQHMLWVATACGISRIWIR